MYYKPYTTLSFRTRRHSIAVCYREVINLLFVLPFYWKPRKCYNFGIKQILDARDTSFSAQEVKYVSAGAFYQRNYGAVSSYSPPSGYCFFPPLIISCCRFPRSFARFYAKSPGIDESRSSALRDSVSDLRQPADCIVLNVRTKPVCLVNRWPPLRKTCDSSGDNTSALLLTRTRDAKYRSFSLFLPFFFYFFFFFITWASKLG